jgi:NAD(P)-dependent dehydrogenase (short-subunit alcohol dehydrogenase family)
MTARPIAIVSGAASGMGRATVRRLAATHTIVGIDREPIGLEDALAGIDPPGHAFLVDVGDRRAVMSFVDETVQRFGVPKVLVNAAGILLRSSALEHTREAWEATFRVNLDGAFWLAQAFTRAALAAGARGSIVNITSIEALYPLTNHIAYSSSKGALLMLTKAMAIELAPRGIRVNAIGPGVIATAMNADLRADSQRSAALLAQIPFGRFGEPDEVAEAVAFLASDRASYITGSLLLVDGGWAAH